MIKTTIEIDGAVSNCWLLFKDREDSTYLCYLIPDKQNNETGCLIFVKKEYDKYIDINPNTYVNLTDEDDISIQYLIEHLQGKESIKYLIEEKQKEIDKLIEEKETLQKSLLLI